MRNLFCCFMLCLCAVIWAGCSDPVRTASITIDKTTRTLQTAESSYKRLTRERLLAIAAEEKKARETALEANGCNPKVALAAQPAGMCQTLVAEAKVKFDGRTGKLVAVVTKLDAGVGLVYAALLASVDALVLLKDGVGSMPALQALVVKAVGMLKDFMLIYTTFTTELGRF